jgi:hypothetical protein
MEGDSVRSSLIVFHPNFPFVRSSFGSGRVNFTCEPRHGALLMLPDSATRSDHLFQTNIMEYAERHVQSWYQHVNETLGSTVRNGSLYLVTGVDKSSNWCLASYSNRRTAIPLSFTADTSTQSTRRCLWQSSGSVDARTCTVLGETVPQNQCVFIRGYKLAIKTSLFRRRLVKVSDIVITEPSDVLAKGKSIPRGARSFSFTRIFEDRGGPSDQTESANDEDVMVEEFPPLGEVSNFSGIMSGLLLNMLDSHTIRQRASFTTFSARLDPLFYILGF